MPVCPHCGHDTTDDEARFCAACGRPIPADAAGPADAADAADESAAESTSVLHLGGAETETSDPAGAGDGGTGGEAVVERLQPGTALLVVRRGPASGARFLLDSDVTTAGRHPDSDIFLDDITVSRHHVEFRRSADGFSIRDLGSLNGTYVNRSRIDDTVLVSGDEVQIGKYRLQFLTGGEQSEGDS